MDERKPTLEELIESITDEDRHEEDAVAVGREII